MTKMVEPSNLPEARHLKRGLETVRQGPEFRRPARPPDAHEHAADHLALIYESRQEQFEAVIPFIRQGLEQGERCLYIADENSREEVLQELRDAGIAVDAGLESGALSVHTVQETYLKNGTFDLNESLALLDSALEEGTTAFEGFRVTVEETWLLREDSATEDFMALEARVNDIFAERDCMALCQYNYEQFPPDVIREVIRTHPLLIHDSRVNDNVYYMPPEEFFGPEQPATEVNRLLGTLQERTATQYNHQRVVQALEAAREGISLLNDDGEFIYVNDAYAETFGYEPKEMIGEHWDALGIEADPEYVYDEVLPTIEREGQWTGTTTCVRSDDSTFLAQHSLTQTEDEELICVIRDITERKEREQDLALFRNLIDRSNDAVFVVNPDTGRFLDVNDTACQRLGYDRTDLLDMAVPDIAKQLSDFDAWQRMAEDIAAEGELTFESVHERRDGTSFPVEVNATFVELDQEYILGIARDVTDRKEYERKLEQSERRYRTLAEHFPNGAVGVYDHNLRYTLVEGAMWDDMASNPEDLEGQTVMEFFPPETAEDIVPNFRAAVEDGETTVTQTEWFGRTFQVWTAPLYNAEGEIFAGLSFAQDITERVERERQLEQSERRYRTLVENFPNGAVSLYDRDLRYIAVGGENIEQVGLSVEKLEGSPVADALPDDIADQLLPHYRAAIDDGEPQTFELEYEDYYYQFRALPVRDEDGKVFAGMGMSQDITDRKERERELERTKDRFKAVFEHSNDAIFINDPFTDEIIDANPAGLDMLGYDREELLSLGPSDFHPHEMDQFRAFVDDVFQDGYGWSDELSCRTKDGEVIPAEISASTIELEGRQLMLAVVRDITERKKHERYQRDLYEITADTDLSFDEKLDRLLDLGRERFGLDIGMLTRIEGTELQIENVQGASAIEEGTTTVSPRSEQFCQKVMAEDRPVAIPDAEAAGRDDDPLYQLFGLGRYLWVKVQGDNEVYGTLCFGDTTPQPEPFTDAEETFLELMSQMVSYELERDHREAQLAGLNAMGRDLLTAETLTDIATATVDHARERLALPVTAVVCYDRQTGTLSPAAQTPQAEDHLPTAALSDRESGPLWDAFVRNEVRILDDLGSIPGAGDDLTKIMVVPLERQGVFVTATRASEGFSAAEIDFVETVAATVKAACTRAAREQQLQEREATLEEQNEALERLDRINTTIRNIDKALVQASSRQEIETAVCEHLADAGPYELAWIGQHDHMTDEIIPEEWAGAEKGYLDEITITADDTPTGQGPGGQSVKTQEPQVINDVIKNRSFEPWRQAALNRGFHACMALPLVYDGTVYGILGVYAGQPGVFDELERTVLAELADTIAYAINAVESKKALVSDAATELELEVHEMSHPLVALTATTDCKISLEGFVPKKDGGLHAFISTQGVSVDEVIDAHEPPVAEDLSIVSEYEMDGEPTCQFEVALASDSISQTTLEHGGVVRDITAADGTARFTLELAADADTREFVETVRTKYPDTELVARRTTEGSPETRLGFYDRLLDRLTDRQLEVLQTAYVSGYFEEPRRQTASNLADTMDISQPTFTTHLRAAHRKVYQQIFKDSTVMS